MSKNHHWRCGATNNKDGKPCRNIVSAKGDSCFRHWGALKAEVIANVPDTKPDFSVLSDDDFEKHVIYVQWLRDEAEFWKNKAKGYEIMLDEIGKLTARNS